MNFISSMIVAALMSSTILHAASSIEKGVLKIDLPPGKTADIKVSYNAHLRHETWLLENKLELVRFRSKDQLRDFSLTNKTQSDFKLEIRDSYQDGSRRGNSYVWRLCISTRFLEQSDIYIKSGCEDGTDKDYDDAIVEVTIR